MIHCLQSAKEEYQEAQRMETGKKDDIWNEIQVAMKKAQVKVYLWNIEQIAKRMTSDIK